MRLKKISLKKILEAIYLILSSITAGLGTAAGAVLPFYGILTGTLVMLFPPAAPITITVATFTLGLFLFIKGYTIKQCYKDAKLAQQKQEKERRESKEKLEDELIKFLDIQLLRFIKTDKYKGGDVELNDFYIYLVMQSKVQLSAVGEVELENNANDLLSKMLCQYQPFTELLSAYLYEFNPNPKAIEAKQVFHAKARNLILSMTTFSPLSGWDKLHSWYRKYNEASGSYVGPVAGLSGVFIGLGIFTGFALSPLGIYWLPIIFGIGVIVAATVAGLFVYQKYNDLKRADKLAQRTNLNNALQLFNTTQPLQNELNQANEQNASHKIQENLLQNKITALEKEKEEWKDKAIKLEQDVQNKEATNLQLEERCRFAEEQLKRNREETEKNFIKPIVNLSKHYATSFSHASDDHIQRAPDYGHHISNDIRISI